MTSWLRTDVQFDLPYGTLTLHARSAEGREFHAAYSALADEEEGKEPQPERVAALVTDFLKRKRPDLAEGLVVIGMRCNLHGMRWEFSVLSNALLKAAPYTNGEKQSVELCPVCRRPLRRGEEPHHLYAKKVDSGYWGGYAVQDVCSEECLTADFCQTR